MSATAPSWISTARLALQNTETDFFRVSPVRYWFDFLLSVTLAYSAATIFLDAAPVSAWLAQRTGLSPLGVSIAVPVVAYIVAIFWLYRLGSLVHEVCHLGHKEMRVFKVVWNVVVGVMTLAPSPFYTRHHRDHHSQRLYGTIQDPEYIINIVRPGNWLSLLAYAALIAAFPLIVFLRFLLAPLTFLHPRLRRWTFKHASALTMNWRYERKTNSFDRWAITAIELLCFLRAAMIPTMVVLGVTHWTRMPLMYSLALGVLFLNQMRQLADHHFESDGSNLELPDHIRDSCNYTSRDFFTWLFFPFSIRYHALHHLFPTLPYHNLKAAHAYLVEHLPADSPYRELDQPSWWSVAKKTFWPPPVPLVLTRRKVA